MITLNSLTSPEGIEEGDQIQMSFTDEQGLTQLKVYEYWAGDGWADYDQQEPVGDEVGFKLGIGAWFCSATPKTICTSGEVKKSSHIHTFTDPWTICSSAFPTAFCPNDENISWGCNEGAQIQTSFTDERGLTQLKVYEYWAGDGWADYDQQDVIDPDFAVAEAGKGFWFIIGDTSETFTEVSPLAE